ncbi:MAG: HAMP domain-containing histidine kinase [bacterium]|nr:HAMP domain-containing histidine kinase [bacterium]
MELNGAFYGKIRFKVDASAHLELIKNLSQVLLLVFAVFSTLLFLFVHHYKMRMSKELLMLERSIEKNDSGEFAQTREFNIEELAMFQRKIKNDSKDMMLLKEELERNENLALIGNFASSVVHDIRNPLSVIDGYTDLIKSICGEESSKYSEKIFASTAMIARLLEDILKFVREQKLELKLERHSPEEVIEHTLQPLEQVIAGSKVEVIKELEEGLEFECDIHRLGRALMNLIKNSAEVSQAGDRIRIRVYREKKRVVFFFFF